MPLTPISIEIPIRAFVSGGGKNNTTRTLDELDSGIGSGVLPRSFLHSFDGIQNHRLRCFSDASDIWRSQPNVREGSVSDLEEHDD